LPKSAATNNARKTDGLTGPTRHLARAGSLKIFKQIPMFIREAYIWLLSQPEDRVEIVNNVTHSLPSAVFHFQRLLMVYRPVCCPLLLRLPPPITFILGAVRQFLVLRSSTSSFHIASTYPFLGFPAGLLPPIVPAGIWFRRSLLHDQLIYST